MNQNFASENWKSFIPHPIDDKNPGYIDFYYFAWQKAFEHIRSIPGMPQNPYMDEGFCDTVIWIWDTCFMSLYCKYAPNVFPGVQSFRNFYQALYEKGTLGFVHASPNEPAWTLSKPGEINPIRVHNSDNPPLFAWAEYENALFTGDVDHLKELLIEKQYLQKHFYHLENLDRKDYVLPNVLKTTNLVHEENGYFWEGGASGMDNSPRLQKGYHQILSTGKMVWNDICFQAILNCNILIKMNKELGNIDDITDLIEEEKYLKNIVNLKL